MGNLYLNTEALFYLITLTLLCLNFYGFFAKAAFKKNLFLKNKKNVESYEWTSDFCDFENLLKNINKNIVHFKKENNNCCPLYENYILFLLSFLPINHFKNYEFYNIKRIISIGHGLCSQVCILLYLCLKKKNIDSKIIGFKGHVLVYVNFNNQNFLLDPDYGIVLKFHPSDVRKNIKKVLEKYKKKIENYKLKKLEIIYKSKYEFIPEKIIKRNIVIEEISYFLKWLIPITIFYLLKFN